MKVQARLLIAVLFLGLGALSFLGCGSEEEVGRFEEDVLSFDRHIDSFSRGCEPDSQGCVWVKLEYPVAESGPRAAMAGIERAQYWFINTYLSGRIDPEAIYSEIKPVIKEYLDEQYRQQIKEGVKRRDYYSHVTGEILFENSSIITLEMNMESFTGGMHSVNLTNIFTVDASSGTYHRSPDRWIKNRDSLTVIAERYFRHKRNIPQNRKLRNTGFHFRKGFTLPKSMGITPRGLLLHYNTYEIAPYRKGATRFTIPYEDIEGLLKMDKIRPD